MGSVYLAEDSRLGRKVALKVILPDLADQPDFRRRFEAEARGAAAIEHPNVVPVYAAGVLDGRLYLAMRFIDGVNLNEALDSHSPLDVDIAVRIVTKVAGALDAAHAAGFVHRDVTPANILLEGELGSAEIYLTDFGLVRGLDTRETQLTRTDQVIANLDYATPEQIQGGRVDARTDVYALGCVLYRLRSGSRPFPGTDAQKMWKIVNEPLPPLRSGGDPLDPVIARATAKDPVQRFPSAGDLARAAAEPEAAATRRLPERSVATGRAAAGYLEGSESKTEVLPSGRPPQPSSRRRSLVIAACAAALLVAGVVAAVLISRGSGGSRTIVRETVTTTTEAQPTSTSASPSVEEEAEASSANGSRRATALPGLEAFEGISYSGFAPQGWEHALVDKRVTDYYENLWREPSDPENTFIRIDGGSPQSVESPMAASESLVEEVRRDPEYREIYYGPDYKEGREAARWVYELDGDKRADYFFVSCGQGLASVGSTTPERYPELAAMFRGVAFSALVHCGE